MKRGGLANNKCAHARKILHALGARFYFWAAQKLGATATACRTRGVNAVQTRTKRDNTWYTRGSQVDDKWSLAGIRKISSCDCVCSTCHPLVIRVSTAFLAPVIACAPRVKGFLRDCVTSQALTHGGLVVDTRWTRGAHARVWSTCHSRVQHVWYNFADFSPRVEKNCKIWQNYTWSTRGRLCDRAFNVKILHQCAPD